MRMKNPFEKNDHKVLIAGIIIGSAIAGGVAYLFLTETGTTIRQELTGHVNRIRDAVMGVEPAPEEEDHATDYLHHEHPKAPKTDRATLKNHVIAGGEHYESHDAENS